MVSHVAPGRGAARSRGRLLEAAATEFAARGFEGAKVDRIAARARVNKAMLYYHFKNKAALYRDILRDVFGAAAEAVEAVPAAGAAPDVQLRAFVAAIAQSAVARPHFPAIWLRELAEGGRHLDQSVLALMQRVLRTLIAILQAGEREGLFRPVHPLMAQMGIVGPLLLFNASTPLRKRWRGAGVPAAGLTQDAALAYVQEAALAALAPRPVARRLSSRRHS
jgi:TetR/AcrR family transcriptional regulator